MDKLDAFRAADAAARERALTDAHVELLAREYRAPIAAAVRSAAKRLARHAHTAAAEPSKWTPPDADELVPLRLADVLAARRNHKARIRVIQQVAGEALAGINIAFDVTNPMVDYVAQRAASRVTSVAGTVRDDVMTIVRNSHEQGLSIPDAAEAIRSQAESLSRAAATRIARTELAGLVNGASVAAARLGDAAEYKQWLSTPDDKTRPDHAETDGQVVPLEEPFDVGGQQLMFPGDQSSADASETVNCRCTVTYPDPIEAINAGGAPMPVKERARLRLRPRAAVAAAPPAEAAPPVTWRALSIPEGVWTSDGRMIDVGATDWRELPLTLMTQFQTEQGHDGAYVSGRIDAYERNDANEVWSTGVFDSGQYGAETARMVADQTLRGVSVDLAEMDVEVELLDGEGNPVPTDEEGFPLDPEAIVAEMKMRATRAVIMGQTVTPFPAFAAGRIELVGAEGEAVTASAVVGGKPRSGTFSIERARFEVPLTMEITQDTVTAAAPVTGFSSSMIAVVPLPDEAAALAQAVEGGQPAEQMHVTIAHIPAEVAPDHQTLVDAMRSVADAFGPIRGEVTGAGHFSAGEDGYPILALVDAPGLDQLRIAVTAALDEAGVPYSQNHGFLPHLTLAYADDAQLPDAQGIVGRPLSFLTLSVVTGDGLTQLALDSGGSGSASGSAEAARTDLPLDAAASTSAEPPREQNPQAPRQAASFDRPDFTLDDVARAKAALDAGLITASEARTVLGFEPRPTPGDLLLPSGVDPSTGALAAALGMLAARQPQPQPIYVAAQDTNPVAAALESVTAGAAQREEQIAAALDRMATAFSAIPAPVVVVEKGGTTRRVDFQRDHNNVATAATIIEE